MTKTNALEAAATKLLLSNGFTAAGQAKKPAVKKGARHNGPFVRIVSVPMGGMTRRWH